MFIDRVRNYTKKFNTKEIFWLIPISILGGILNFFPHLNYPYLFHVDEWFHVTYAKQFALGSTINWYTGDVFHLEMERGWHVMLATIQYLFNLDITQWVFIPTVFQILAILSVYLFVSRLLGKKEALISSLLIALLPSNATIGGSVFLVPVNTCLIFIPLGLIFAFKLNNLKNTYNYILLFVLLTFTLYAYPPTAIILLTIIFLYFLLSIFSKDPNCRKNATYLLITVIISILVSLPNFIYELEQRGMESIKFNFWVFLEGLPLLLGIIPTIFFVLGFYLLFKNGKKESLALLFTALILIVNIIFFNNFGLSYLLPYQRTYIPLFLIMSIIASHGFIKLIDLDKKKIGSILLVLILISTTVISVHENINANYYKIINDDDYENFLWIKQNSPNNATILSDPWKARALATIAERRVYAAMPFGPDEEQMKVVNLALNFLQQNCTNTSFLIDNNISIVYTNICQNPNLIELKENIYFFEK